MNGQEQHTMVLEQEYTDGRQEWVCPTCGRRFIMQWPPNYKRTILEPGDETAIHSGGTGGLVMGTAQAAPVPENLPEASLDLPGGESEEDSFYLLPFTEYLDKLDL